MHRKLNTGLVIVAVMIFFAGRVHATPIANGDFQTGDLAGWSSETVDFGIATVVVEKSSSMFSALASAEISQPFAWEVGETLSFDWAFSYADWGSSFDDYAIFGVQDLAGSGSFTTILSHSTSSDWQNYTYTFTSSGAGNIFFGARNAGQEVFDSVARFDNIASGAMLQNPEPTSMLLLGTGLLGISRIFRRRSRQQ